MSAEMEILNAGHLKMRWLVRWLTEFARLIVSSVANHAGVTGPAFRSSPQRCAVVAAAAHGTGRVSSP